MWAFVVPVYGLYLGTDAAGFFYHCWELSVEDLRRVLRTVQHWVLNKGAKEF